MPPAQLVTNLPSSDGALGQVAARAEVSSFLHGADGGECGTWHAMVLGAETGDGLPAVPALLAVR
jgi:hypothetical protein